MRRLGYGRGLRLLLALGLGALPPAALLAAPLMGDGRWAGTGLILLAFVPVVGGWAALQAVIAAAARGWSRRAAGAVQASPRHCLLWGGALALLVALVLMLLASLRAVGGGLAGLLLAALAVFVTLGMVGVSAAVGHALLGPHPGAGDPGQPLAVLVGGALLAAALFIPVVGWLAVAAALLIGLGAAAQALVAGRASTGHPVGPAGVEPPSAES